MPSLVGGGRKAGATAGRSTSSEDTAGDKPASILKGPAKRKSPMSKGADTVMAEVGTPKNRGPSKNARPQGTSPMAQEKAQQEDDLEVTSLTLDIDDDGDKSGTDEDQGSIGKLISSTRKELFGSALKEATDRASRTRSWRPITSKDTPAQAERGGKGATFAAETIFHERSSTPTEGIKAAAGTQDCVVCMRFKLQPCDVQETLIGLLAHCLAVLHERDKAACILNRKKLLEAKRVSDLPRDFTDFYDEWGLWDKDIKMFLNTIKKKGQRSFTALFYFRCSGDPLFAKTLLKMAKQSQHKGTVAIELKPCQHLDTTRDIIFFNLPFCDATGLRDYIRTALTDEKSSLIHKYPTKFPRKD